MPDLNRTPNGPEAIRVLALDAVRGLAILMMCLSGVVPEGLPNAMYHGYYPRWMPDDAGVWQLVADPHTHRPWWSSFTWVDWVFPLFLFAMGTAFPIALGKKLDKAVPVSHVVLGVIWRGLTLVGFAVYVKQIVPSFIESPTTTGTLLIGFLGFVLLFPVLMRLPRTFNYGAVIMIRTIGVAACIGLVVCLNLNDGDTFSFSQNDIIILLLAHMAIVGSLIWLITRKHPWLRLFCLIVPYFAHHQAMYGGLMWADPVTSLPGKMLDLTWINSVLPWDVPTNLLNLSVLYDFTWYKFLFIVIPGTIIGDLLIDYMKHIGKDSLEVVEIGSNHSWSFMRYICLSVVFVGLIVWVFVGLQCHGRVLVAVGEFKLFTPWVTWIGVIPLAAVGWVTVHNGIAPLNFLLRSVFVWGLVWLFIGLTLEPFEGGITKGPPVPLSYYFVALGLSVLLLGAMTIWIDVLGQSKSFGVFISNGQNPMLAYVGIRNLLVPLISLPFLAPFTDIRSINGIMVHILGGSSWMLLIWSILQTLLLALIVMCLTRCHILWRS